MEKLELPANYDYLDVSEYSDECTFRIKQVMDESSALAWLSEFSDTTKSTWRVTRTYPKSGRINIFRIDLHCVHNTDRRATGKRSSKHTDCPAKLSIIVKRFISNSKRKNKDMMTSEYPAIITIKGEHNHELNTVVTLKYRDLSQDVKSKFIKLFSQGHSVISALNCHKEDLMREYGDKYYLVVADRKYLPSYAAVHYLFKKNHFLFKKKIPQKSVKHSKGKKPQSLITSDNNETNQSLSNDIHQSFTSIIDGLDMEEDAEKLSKNELEQLENIFQRIKNGVTKDPVNYVPAIRKFLKNVDDHAKTDWGLLSALHTFGTIVW